jgi:hypothetical protein
MIVLVVWSLLICAWMYSVFLPVMFKKKLKYNQYRPKEEFFSQFPPEVRWKFDNYNHLMEQPTIFYAVALVLAVMGEGHGLNLQLAWGYVMLRVIHSLIQVLWNDVTARFGAFISATLVLAILAVRTALIVFEV